MSERRCRALPGSRNRKELWKVKRDHLAERLQEIVDRAAALHADQFTAVHKDLEKSGVTRGKKIKS